MVLIIESGSTKADWRIIDNMELVESFQTNGWNPLLTTQKHLSFRLHSNDKLSSYKTKIKQLFFYGPATSHSDTSDILIKVLQLYFTRAKIFISSDMMAAARASYTGKPTLVSIIGTGSNTAFYDGVTLEQTSPSLGFILGDQGSGAALGKSLLKSVIYKEIPNHLYLKFKESYNITTNSVLSSVYKEPNANSYLASFVPFLVANKGDKFILDIVKNEFKSYVNQCLKANIYYNDFPITFVGSVAFYFSDLIRELILDKELSSIQFIKSPIDNLVKFHQKDHK